LTPLPWLVLSVTLATTWFAWDHEHQTSRNAMHTQFDFALRETVSRVEQSVVGYEQILVGVQSLFATTDLTNREAMRAYVKNLQLDANFAGVQTIGVLEWVPEERKALLLAANPREPARTDFWLDPVRRSACEKARDSGIAAISGKLALSVEDGSGTTQGFLMVLPVYAPGQPHHNLEQRRARLIGWVYADFHVDDFMSSLYGRLAPGLTLSLYDATQPLDSNLLFASEGETASFQASEKSSLHADEYMVVAGHNWVLSMKTQKAFDAVYGRGIETVTAVFGIVLSLLLAALVRLMVNGRDRALRLAEAMTEELRHMAQHDPLTGLPNRALFNDRLNQELAVAKRQTSGFALMFLDLDHFKPINDNFGHDVGDLVLSWVAAQLQKGVRAADTVGRIGGDEFVVLLAHLGNPEVSLGLAEKLHQALHQPFAVGGHEFSLSCCIGVALFPTHGTDSVALIKSADDAMYQAKKAGRDCVRLSS